jgi:hypothetical protein
MIPDFIHPANREIRFTKPLDLGEDRDIGRIQLGIAAHNRLGDDERDAFNVRDMIELEESSSESDMDVLLPTTTSRPPGRPKKETRVVVGSM